MDFKLRKDNVGKLLNSAAVQADLKRRADRIAAAAGPGMVASVQPGRNRARASVITATQRAREAEARDRALTRALDAGRG
jgi:tRNA A37 threonylcarbamoyltransferase TsaD